jgi:hypothetical protein
VAKVGMEVKKFEGRPEWATHDHRSERSARGSWEGRKREEGVLTFPEEHDVRLDPSSGRIFTGRFLTERDLRDHDFALQPSIVDLSLAAARSGPAQTTSVSSASVRTLLTFDSGERKGRRDRRRTGYNEQ